MAVSTPTIDLLEAGNTNCYYSDEEREALQRARASVNEALLRLHEEKAAIERREHELKSEIERYNIALAPIKRLPHDVLRYIFEICCETHQAPPLHLVSWFGSHPSPQILLSHICSTWRQIMLNSPPFWNDVALEMTWTAQTIRLMDISREWLSRAGDMLCSAELSFSPTENLWRDRREATWYRNVVKKVLSLHKFKKLRITFAEDYLQELLELPEDNLSCIEELSLQYSNTKSIFNSRLLESPLNFQRLFTLISFSLRSQDAMLGCGPSGCGPSVATRFAGIPWHQLRHIDLGVAVPALFCLEILEHSSQVLETCSIVISEDPLPVTATPTKPVCCDQLRSFKVDVSHTGPSVECPVDPFLGLLRMPNLKSLVLGTSGHTDMPFRVQTITKVKEMSGVHLEKLTIVDTKYPIDVRALLITMPSLRCVDLPTTVDFPEEAMRELAAGSIGPNIEDLTLRAYDLELETLFQMVEVRCAAQNGGGYPQQVGATPFKSVALTCHLQDLEPSYTKRIQYLKEKGVRIDVCFEDEDDLDDDSDDIYGYHDDYYDGDLYLHF